MIEIEGMGRRALNRSEVETSIVRLRSQTTAIIDGYENRIDHLRAINKKLDKQLTLSMWFNLVSCVILALIVAFYLAEK